MQSSGCPCGCFLCQQPCLPGTHPKGTAVVIRRLSLQPSVSGKHTFHTFSNACSITVTTLKPMDQVLSFNAALSVMQCRQQLSVDIGRPIYQISLSSIAALTDSTDADHQPQQVLVAVRGHHQVAIYKAAQQQDRCNSLYSISCATLSYVSCMVCLHMIGGCWLFGLFCVP